MGVGERHEVAVLGGGVAGLTTALELSATPELRDRYHVTVYQLGWRCGGKCATGRSGAELGYRNEEHGLHFWFGGYSNAFQMLKRCYDELGDRAPFPSMSDAWTPLSTVFFYDSYDGRWSSARRQFVMTEGHPWDDVTTPRFWAFLETILGASKMSLAHHLTFMHSSAHPAAATGTGPSRALRRIGNRVERAATQAFVRRAKHGRAEPKRFVRGMARILEWLRDRIYRRHMQGHEDDDEVRHHWSHIDTTITALIGFLKDDLLDTPDGLASINHLDFSRWLLDHGLKAISVDGPDMRVTYDESFANILGPSTTGTVAHPLQGKWAFAAGAALYTMIRTAAPNNGAMMYQATAGMGDTAIAPMYQTLLDRGVGFEFFQRVDGLGVEGNRIETIALTPQARPKGVYDPLVDVSLESGARLRSWPNAPKWSELEGGDVLQRSGVAFERGETEPGATPRTLRLGQHFDTVVLAISAAALPSICGELGAANPDFARMLDNTYTTMTQAFQLWLTRPVDELGFPEPHAATSSFLEPLDTGCDETQVLPYEAWPPDAAPKSVWYFCGSLADQPDDTPAALDDRVRRGALGYIDQIYEQWPQASPDGSFDWSLLHDPEHGTGVERFERQYWRANHTPTERYVQTPPGSVEHRLRPDESGFTNLFLAGDWTRNGWNIGAVEPAVMSGMLASKAICGSPEHVAWYSAAWLIDGRRHREQNIE
jgi:uncharacterized protein with NAD-binding domain and iron-sulfur cluster